MRDAMEKAYRPKFDFCLTISIYTHSSLIQLTHSIESISIPHKLSSSRPPQKNMQEPHFKRRLRRRVKKQTIYKAMQPSNQCIITYQSFSKTTQCQFPPSSAHVISRTPLMSSLIWIMTGNRRPILPIE
jgi:hypothetical protein